MKATTVTLAQLKQNNPCLCLSAKRPLKLCWQCSQYPTCESKIVNADFDKEMKRKEEAKQRCADVIREINEIWPTGDIPRALSCPGLSGFY